MLSACESGKRGSRAVRLAPNHASLFGSVSSGVGADSRCAPSSFAESFCLVSSSRVRSAGVRPCTRRFVSERFAASAAAFRFRYLLRLTTFAMASDASVSCNGTRCHTTLAVHAEFRWFRSLASALPCRMVERMGYDIEDARWPLVVARATKYLGDPAATDASYRKLESILEREQRFLLVFDLRGASSTPGRRRRFHEWCQSHEDALTRLLVAGAIVAGSGMERGLVTAALWVRTPPWPMRVFTDSSEAETWLLANFTHLTGSKTA
jgi:hypothetical protein